jgi:hypothetical protein
MRQLLRLHPASRSVAAESIEVELARSSADCLLLSYVVSGKISCIRLPSVTAATRSDELWRHTCFEAFVRASLAPEYYEFNFAPSTQWAAYRFSDYRSGMCVASEISALPIEVRSSARSYTLQASLQLNCLSALPRQTPWRVGLSALIEDTGGRRSYWALAHPCGKPDFHHADCFAHELSPAAQP